MYIRGLPVDVEEGKEALGKLLSGVMGSGSCVASCRPSVILQLSLADTCRISQLSIPTCIQFTVFCPSIYRIHTYYFSFSLFQRKKTILCNMCFCGNEHQKKIPLYIYKVENLVSLTRTFEIIFFHACCIVRHSTMSISLEI